MKTKLVHYSSDSGGLTLHLIPETEVEATLLSALWKHGRLELLNGVDGSGLGFGVTAFYHPQPAAASADTPKSKT